MSIKKLVGAFVALALVVSVSASASVSAQSPGQAHMQQPKFAKQCEKEHYKKYGFSSEQACKDYVKQHSNNPGQGHDHGYGYGKDKKSHTANVIDLRGILSHIGSIANSTFSFVFNMFH